MDEGIVDYDSALREYVGQFGKYQILSFILLGLVEFTNTMYHLEYVFILATPEHWCRNPYLKNTSLTDEQIKSISIPRYGKEFERCAIYKRNYTHLVSDKNINIDLFEKGQTVLNETNCKYGWEYDKSVYEKSLVSEWDLVCDRKWMKGTTQSCFYLGHFVGSLLTGYLGDIFGRRSTITVSTISFFVFAIAQMFANNYILFCIIRFCLSVVITGSYQAAYVLSIELVGPAWRVFVGNGFMIFWAVSYVMVGAVAYFIRDYFYLQLAFNIIALPVVVLVVIFVPESPRWLIAKGRIAQGHEMLRKIAEQNGTKLPKDIIVTVHTKTTGTIIDLMKSPNMRKNFLVLGYIWFACGFIFFFISLNTSNIGGSDHVNFMIAGAIEIPAYIYNIWILNKFGRRRPMSSALILTGLCLLSLTPVPKDMPIIIITVTIIGKFFATASYAMSFIFTTELSPTVIRNFCLGFSESLGRISTVVAPEAHLLGDYSRVLMLSLYSAITVLAGVLVLLLPETKDRHLPETVAEGEEFSKDFTAKDAFCPCLTPKDKEGHAKKEEEQNLLLQY